MALSNSFDFTLSRDELIKRSLLMIGAISAGQTPNATDVTDASQVLNLMLKAWQADGLQLWQVAVESITPVQGRETYTLGPAGNVSIAGKPPAILEAYRRNTSTSQDVPLNRISRTQYWELPDKTQQGIPVSYYWDVQQDVGANDLSVWPTADATFAAGDTIEVLYQMPFDDMDAAANNLAFPQEWHLAVAYGLACLLSGEYGMPLSERRQLREEAKEEKARVMDWDQEQTSVFFQPEHRG